MKGRIKVKANKSLSENAIVFLTEMYDRLVSHQEKVIGHPLLKTELHRMRIAGKPLRYAMEIFEPTLGKKYKICLDELKHLIELMGIVHDCDVMKLSLQNYLQELRLYNYSCNNKFEKISTTDITQLIERQSKQRATSFAEMCTVLRTWKRENFRGRLVKSFIMDY